MWATSAEELAAILPGQIMLTCPAHLSVEGLPVRQAFQCICMPQPGVSVGSEDERMRLACQSAWCGVTYEIQFKSRTNCPDDKTRMAASWWSAHASDLVSGIKSDWTSKRKRWPRLGAVWSCFGGCKSGGGAARSGCCGSVSRKK